MFYLDEIGWKMIKANAKKLKKAPKTIVIQALKRAAKMGLFNEKSKDA